jgi:hypothetical protein
VDVVINQLRFTVSLAKSLWQSHFGKSKMSYSQFGKSHNKGVVSLAIISGHFGKNE